MVNFDSYGYMLVWAALIPVMDVAVSLNDSWNGNVAGQWLMLYTGLGFLFGENEVVCVRIKYVLRCNHLWC